ncbi:hypothetical protein RIVM261_001420 [Rivularia sp. IAM M-261]|nr:hypothetical protein RIVM261_001420 [Rivularia sp. IAM M-261]
MLAAIIRIMDKNEPLELNRESLYQLSQGQLVDIVIEQAKSIQELKKSVIELEVEVQRLKVSKDLDSKTVIITSIGRYFKKIKEERRK